MEVITMKTAAISKLKASLSEYLARVKAGEEVVVTERGKPVAKIIPLDRGKAEISAHLLTLERAGLIRIGTGNLPKGFWNLSRPKDKKGLLVKALLEEREEGR
jgi:prevent-host-death family protein